MTTENQTHIPVGWKSNKLGAICKVQKGVQFNKIELAEYGLYPCINGGIEPSGYSDLWNTNEDTITISEGGNSCGYVNFQRTKFWCGGHCYTLLNVQDGLDYEFLFWALKGKQDLIMDLRVGSGLPNIQQKAIKEFSFISPTSPTEQQKIASILSKLDEAITQTEQLIDKYKKIKEGLMHDLLTRGIDEQGNIRSEETHKFKDSPLGRIPVEWEVDKLERFCDKIGDGTHTSVNFSVEGEIPFLFVSCISPFDIDFEKISHISNHEYEIIAKNKNTKTGTVLYSLVGSYGNAVTLKNDDKVTFQRHIGFIETKRNEILPEFLTIFLNSSFGVKQANDLAEGNAQKTISLKALRSYIIVKPLINEQRKAIEYFNTIQTLLEDFNITLLKLNNQKSGLMHDLLTGKIRVQI